MSKAISTLGVSFILFFGIMAIVYGCKIKQITKNIERKVSFHPKKDREIFIKIPKSYDLPLPEIDFAVNGNACHQTINDVHCYGNPEVCIKGKWHEYKIHPYYNGLPKGGYWFCDLYFFKPCRGVPITAKNCPKTKVHTCKRSFCLSMEQTENKSQCVVTFYVARSVNCDTVINNNIKTLDSL